MCGTLCDPFMRVTLNLPRFSLVAFSCSSALAHVLCHYLCLSLPNYLPPSLLPSLPHSLTHSLPPLSCARSLALSLSRSLSVVHAHSLSRARSLFPISTLSLSNIISSNLTQSILDPWHWDIREWHSLCIRDTHTPWHPVTSETHSLWDTHIWDTQTSETHTYLRHTHLRHTSLRHTHVRDTHSKTHTHRDTPVTYHTLRDIWDTHTRSLSLSHTHPFCVCRTHTPHDIRDTHSVHRVAKTHKMSCLYRSFCAKEPYNYWLFSGKWPATSVTSETHKSWVQVGKDSWNA